MTAHNLKIQALIEVQKMRAEGMKAYNDMCKIRDLPPGWTGQDFDSIANEIERLANSFVD